MKNCYVLYLVIPCLVVLNGCSTKPDIPDSVDNKLKGLVLLEGDNICQDTLSNKMWAFSKEGPFSSLEEAYQYVSELELGGYDDWRLPTKSELFNLFYLNYWKNDTNCVMNHKGDFWTVSKNQVSSVGHWEDYLLCGPNYKFVASFKGSGYVRAIRP